MSEKEKKPIWSADGMCLINERAGIFKTTNRLELKKDRDEVDHIMKKMACESRKDNDWRDCEDVSFQIRYSYGDFSIFEGVELGSGIGFNQAYFNKGKDTQECLDFLLKKYTEARLKEIWGVK